MKRLTDMWNWWWGSAKQTAGTFKHPPPLPKRRLLSASSIALAALGAVGLMLLSTGPRVPPQVAPVGGEELAHTAAVSSPDTGESAYQDRLEQELTSMLTQLTGAGNTKVFLTLVSGPTREFAADTTESRQTTEEVDKQGGTRTTTSVQTDRRLVTVRSQDGGEAPVVRVEHRPQVQGVMILADGADDAAIRYQIIKAVSTVLGIAEYRVTVLPKQK